MHELGAFSHLQRLPQVPLQNLLVDFLVHCLLPWAACCLPQALQGKGGGNHLGLKLLFDLPLDLGSMMLAGSRLGLGLSIPVH